MHCFLNLKNKKFGRNKIRGVKIQLITILIQIIIVNFKVSF